MFNTRNNQETSDAELGGEGEAVTVRVSAVDGVAHENPKRINKEQLNPVHVHIQHTLSSSTMAPYHLLRHSTALRETTTAPVCPDDRCYNSNGFGRISSVCHHQSGRRQRVKFPNQWIQIGQLHHDGPGDAPNMPKRSNNQPAPGAKRSQGEPSARRARGGGTTAKPSASVQHKMEITMMISVEH